MIINWYGQNCFKIVFQRGRNGSTSIIIDPPEKESGIRGPKLDADILLITDPSRKIEPENCFLIQGAGEYDIMDAYIQGISVSGNISFNTSIVQECISDLMPIFSSSPVAASYIA